MKKPADKDAEAQKIGRLIALYIQGTIGPEEHNELDAWVAESDENMRLFEELTDEKNIEKGLAEMEAATWKEPYQKLLQKAGRKKHTIRPWLIAASLILVAGAGWWFITKAKNEKPVPSYAAEVEGDKPPGGAKAILTLANGKNIVLDSAQNGNLAVQGNAEILKEDSSLSYNRLPKAGVAQAVVYNTLSTPKGGQYSVILADGTKVWLNAASSIKFPTAFIQNEREVDITGEAYFEVAASMKTSADGEGKTKRAFVVRANGVEVRVLGTHFNVNAYKDEAGVTTTLVEGSVKVTKGNAVRILKPGQEAETDRNNDAIIVRPVDASEAVAWKDGMFVFSNSDIGSVTRKLSRWYGIDVTMKDSITEHFNATIPCTLPLSKVLRLLEKTGLAHFKLEEGKLEVNK